MYQHRANGDEPGGDANDCRVGVIGDTELEGAAFMAYLGRSHRPQNQGDSLDKPAAQAGVGLDGSLEALPGGKDGGGAVIDWHLAGCAGLCNGAAVDLGDEDLEAREVFGRAVVAEVGYEPAAGGGVVEGTDELTESLGTWVRIAHDV